MPTTLDYGLIGNCKTAALVSKTGAIEWCCFPRFDSPSVFAKILDREKGGSFEITPVGKYTVTQHYYPDTNILESTFKTRQGKFKVYDYFPRYREGETIVKLQEIHRYIKVMDGHPKVRIVFNPKFHYASTPTTLEQEDNRIIAIGGPHQLYLYSDLELNKILRGSAVSLRKENYLVLSYDRPEKPSLPLVKDAFRRTMWYWKFFVRRSSLPNIFQKEVKRSVLLLKLLTYDSGAIIAAPTTSIPEIVGSSRTWDYRYCWLRDASFTIDAFFKLCHFDEAESFINWVLRICQKSDSKLQPMYGIEGETDLKETTLPHLKGYKNSTPVRIGNAAVSQKQIDVYGEVIETLYLYYNHFQYGEINDNIWNNVYKLVQVVVRQWRYKDNGLWEFRKQPQHHTFSKLMCWVALDRGVKIAKRYKKLRIAKKWSNVRQRIRNDILTKAWNNEKQTFTQIYGTDVLDASLLLMSYFGFLPATDPRLIKTVQACERELVKDGFVYRYAIDDGLGKPQNAFTICSFWYIDALYMQGRVEEAKKIFRKIIRYGNHLGLFSEDIDPGSKELTGNFPQAYTHLALINTATLLDSGRIRRKKCNIRLAMLRE